MWTGIGIGALLVGEAVIIWLLWQFICEDLNNERRKEAPARPVSPPVSAPVADGHAKKIKRRPVAASGPVSAAVAVQVAKDWRGIQQDALDELN